MRQWVVGRISLGVILIGCGIALLSWRLSGTVLPTLYLKWWPACLLILGLEILASSWQRFEGTPRFTYDGVSLFLIVIIVLFSLSLSFLDGLGLTARIIAQ